MKNNLSLGSGSKLLKTTGIYMIGSMLSKALNLVILPYISIQLTSEEYGVFDLIQTIVSVVLPIFTMQSIDAAFRFVYLEEKDKKGNVITNVWFLILSGSVLFIALAYTANALFLHLAYINYLVIYYFFNMLLNMFQRIARCYNNDKVYSISGVLQTVVLLTAQFCFLKFFNMKEDGLVYAYAVSVIVTSLFIEICIRHIKECKIKYINREQIKKIVKFSAPLIPNSISWWAISSVNKVIVVAFISYSANGIYSMSSKFASIVTMVANTFQLAWQEYGLTEKDNPDRVNVFSNVFSHYLIVLSCITSCGILLQQVFFDTLIDAKYAESFLYIPIVMIGVAFSAVNSFYGAGYFIYEKTGGAFKTTIAGAAINVALCLLLIKPMGLYGVAISSCVAYCSMWIIRAVTMRDYFKIKISIKPVVFLIITVTAAIFIYYQKNSIASFVTVAVICLTFAVMYAKYAIEFIKKLKNG